jgi:low temperature requirement protein LtrA
MDLISLLITLVVIGVALWAVNTYIPMDGKIKQIVNIVVVLGVVLWLFSVFSGYLPHVRVGK